MTIKGTLDTFHLLDLLQMLAFNQKVGTLVLETAKGPRTVYVDSGTFGFVKSDARTSVALARVLRRTNGVPADRLARGVSIAANANRFLGDALLELGALDDEARAAAWNEAFRELFFDLLQTSIAKFEFYEQKTLAPDGASSTPIDPLYPVDGALLEVTRQGDEWTSLRTEIPSDDEVFERTSIPPTPASADDGIPEWLPRRLLPLLDGRLSVAGLVERSDCDRFSVVKYLASLLRDGAIRPMTTERLVERADEASVGGAPAAAIPLLRRALERGDGHPTVRVRYADALAASGDVAAGASELDTYAASFEAADPVGVFDALRRGLEWRGGDPSTAARLCDHYLRHANALRGRASQAVEALRLLVRGAVAAGRASDAATRLAAFVERGDVPGEDRVALADLFTAAGRPIEASQALARRAEDLVLAGRLGPAKDLLRRALGHDPTRIDVRRRLADLEGAERRRRRRRRVLLLGLLLVLVVGSAGAVYLVSDGKAARAVDDAVGRATVLARDAEARFRTSLEAWHAAVEASRPTGEPDTRLAAAGATLEAETARIASALRAGLETELTELGRHSSTSRGDAGLGRMRALESSGASMIARATEAIRAVDARAQRALEAGEKAFERGVFREADPRLREAIQLSFKDAGRTTRARRFLAQVEDYVARFGTARGPFDDAVRRGDTDRAWTLGVGIFREFLDSDLSRELLLPVPVTTTPAGASVRLEATGAELSTPTTVGYSPFADATLHVRLAGHVPSSVRLPPYRSLREDALAGVVKPFRVAVELPAGPRWRVPALAAGAGPFVAGDAIWTTTKDSLRVLEVRAADGNVAEVRSLAPFGDRIRLAGRTAIASWAIVGHRTFVWLADGATPWEFPTTAPLDRPPATTASGVVLVDEAGTLYAFDAKGASVWKATLTASTAQDLYVHGGELLTSTKSGQVVAVAVADGTIRTLSAASPGSHSLVAPFADGILVVGGKDGAAILDERGTRTPLGSATADPAVRPAFGRDGIAWVDAAGRVLALPTDKVRRTVVVVEALGPTALPPAISDGVVYAVGRDGVLRAARLDAPTRVLWSCPLDGAPASGPVIQGGSVHVRTSAGLAAYDH